MNLIRHRVPFKAFAFAGGGAHSLARLQARPSGFQHVQSLYQLARSKQRVAFREDLESRDSFEMSSGALAESCVAADVLNRHRAPMFAIRGVERFAEIWQLFEQSQRGALDF